MKTFVVTALGLAAIAVIVMMSASIASGLRFFSGGSSEAPVAVPPPAKVISSPVQTAVLGAAPVAPVAAPLPSNAVTAELGVDGVSHSRTEPIPAPGVTRTTATLRADGTVETVIEHE